VRVGENFDGFENAERFRDPIHGGVGAVKALPAWRRFFGKHESLKINDAAPSVGREAITKAAQSFMTAFPDLVIKMDRLAGHSKTEYHWTLTGTNTGPGGTGKFVRFSGFEEWDLGSDGLIAKSLGHFDAEDYQRQLNADAKSP
jgi:hypothetical protein